MRRPILIGLISCGSVCYWIYTYNGAVAFQKLIVVDSAIIDGLLITSRVTSCLSNAFFLYQIGMKFNPWIESRKEALIMLTIPLGALQFFTGGLLGARLWELPENIAVLVGLVLYTMRVFSLIDSSRRLPAIIEDIKKSFQRIYVGHDLPELIRTTLTFGVTAGLTFLSIDSMYMPLHMIFNLFVENAVFNHYASLLLAGQAALTTLPMAWYWYRRGLIQLSNGGQPELNSENPDPTDRYTALALGMSFLLVIPVVSRLSGTNGPLSDEFGYGFLIASVLISLLFTLAANVPNNAVTLRNAGSYLGNVFFSKTESQDEEVAEEGANTGPADEENDKELEEGRSSTGEAVEIQEAVEIEEVDKEGDPPSDCKITGPGRARDSFFNQGAGADDLQRNTCATISQLSPATQVGT